MKVYKGTLTTKVVIIIPFLLYVSKSSIESTRTESKSQVYAIHITPLIIIGLTRPGTGKIMDSFDFIDAFLDADVDKCAHLIYNAKNDPEKSKLDMDALAMEYGPEVVTAALDRFKK